VKVVVTGIGLVSALGATLETSWRSLLLGQIGIRVHQPFSELSHRPLALVGLQPGNLEQLTQQAVKAALEDANLAPPLLDCGVVIGSSRSYQAIWEQLARHRLNSAGSPDNGDEHEAFLSKAAMLYQRPPAILIAQQISAAGPVLSPMAACATGIWAIAQGFELIQTGQCQRVLVGAVEAPVTPLTLAGFTKMGALAQTGAYPFDCQREGFVLGEGATVIVLESAKLAGRRSAKVYGQILGFGLTADGYHVSAPDPERQIAAIAAIQQCLSRSGLLATSIDYIHAHGTGTQLNDRAEAMLLQNLFPDGVPVSSTKGATGHTLGASGALGAAFCLMALQQQILPPCVGLQQPAFDLDLIVTPRFDRVATALCFSFGFGGQNAILALGSCSY
jgi:3-oxoacyl-[acyl-carrier-protein] synthase II